MNKRFIRADDLLRDSFRLAANIHAAGFKPDFLVGLWRGGSAVGIAVQEGLEYFGTPTDHIAIRTSYSGAHRYSEMVSKADEIRVHGLQYLLETLCSHHSMLIVDDVYSTGRNVRAIVDRLRRQCKRNMSRDLRIAAPYYRHIAGSENSPPDYYLQQTEDWLVLPYELTGISRAEMAQHKAWILPLLDELNPDWR